MVATLNPRTRVETPERWAKALQRAVKANPTYLELAGGDGAFAVASSADPELGYVATAGTCTCEAGRAGDPVCLHRALVRALLGILPTDAVPARPACRVCDDRGYLVDPDGRGRPERCYCAAGRRVA